MQSLRWSKAWSDREHKLCTVRANYKTHPKQGRGEKTSLPQVVLAGNTREEKKKRKVWGWRQRWFAAMGWQEQTELQSTRGSERLKPFSDIFLNLQSRRVSSARFLLRVTISYGFIEQYWQMETFTCKCQHLTSLQCCRHLWEKASGLTLYQQSNLFNLSKHF